MKVYADKCLFNTSHDQLIYSASLLHGVLYMHHVQISSVDVGSATYVLKIINPNNKGGEVLVNHIDDIKEVFTSADALMSKLCDSFSEYTEGYDTLFGYITPGHGFKGKQEQITTDIDLSDMYEAHKKRKRIMLWLKCKPARKRVEHPESNVPSSKRQNPAHTSLIDAMSAVGSIVDSLKQKHGQRYTPVQLNCWAHMIHTHKHDSLDVPPNKPFFGKKKSADPIAVSPGKRINLRSECITQLDKWHQLKERGVVSEEQYTELQKTILTDIKKF